MARKMDVESYIKFRDWIPVRCYEKDGRDFVDWCYLGKERLIEPFFDDSVQKRFREPFNLLFRHQTPLEFLGDIDEVYQGLKPTGFIFHLSRCGSTLISQMLAAMPENIVISEASPIDYVLRKASLSEDERVIRLRWVINALGQKRSDSEQNYFIKFDTWNTLSIDIVQKAFPDVPWIFLYRNPAEIIVSQIRQPGAQMIRGLIKEILPELRFDEVLQLSSEEYCARVIGKICKSVLEHLSIGEGLPVNYVELPEIMYSKIQQHFQIEFSEEQIDLMASASKFNAKTPVVKFVSDADSKRSSVNEVITKAAEKHVDPFYEAIEAIRKKA